MQEEQLIEYIDDLGISRDQILREEAEMDILLEFSKNKLSSKMLFYGGTALRLVYGSPRFSEDIDLLIIKKTDFKEFADFVKNLIKKYNHWALKDIKDKHQTMFALINIKDDKLKHNFSVKIEAHKFGLNSKIKAELSLIKSPLSIAEPLLLVPTIEELKKQKERALVGRKKGRDLFDLWYISQVLRENFVLPEKTPSYKKREFENELKVFLPKKYYSVIKQIYERIKEANKKN
jgi:predicted nucleotidyltransferase component of viral defense system